MEKMRKAHQQESYHVESCKLLFKLSFLLTPSDIVLFRIEKDLPSFCDENVWQKEWKQRIQLGGH